MPHLRPYSAARDDFAVRRMLTLSFAGSFDGAAAYLDVAGRENLRVLVEGDADDGASAPNACLARIPMGQFFGGARVPMVGIAAVAVPPEARGGQRARQLMESCIRELAAERTTLACLYASTQSLYRKVGFEQAGGKFETRFPLRQLTDGTRDLPIEPFDSMGPNAEAWTRCATTGVPDPRLERCYRAFAARFNGMLDRGPYIWRRTHQNRDSTFHGFAVVPGGPGTEIEGYVFLTEDRAAGGRFDVRLSDLAFTTDRGARRILGLLRDFTSMGLSLSFIGGHCHPIVPFLGQQWIEVSLRDYWMLRIVDAERALALRGYAPSVRLDVPIDIADDLVPSNAGMWRFRVQDGRGSLVRAPAAASGEPRVCMTIRGLASIYSGHMNARQAALLGLAAGPDDLLTALDAAFAGGTPWMADHF